MKVTMISLLAALLAPSVASAQEVKKDDVALIPGWAWVTVKNLEPIKNGNVTFGYDDSCGIQEGGTVTVIGVVEDRLLVRYSTSGVKYGTPCPSGIHFFTTKESFSSLSTRYERARQAKQAERDLVERLIKK